MSRERLLRLGRLAELRGELEETSRRIKRLLEEIRSLAFPLEGVEGVDAKAIAQASGELEDEQAHYQETVRQINELERA